MDEDKKIISEPDDEGVRHYSLKTSKQIYGGEKKRKTGRNILVFVIIIAAVIVAGVLMGKAGDSDDSYANISNPYIAIVHVEGTISSDGGGILDASEGYDHQWTLKAIEDARKNGNNKGLVLFVDSPGGGVYESDEIYMAVKKYKEETGRPVYSSMGSMAASGGYYVSAPADKIIANRNCWTGSIGVTIGTIYDISGLLNKYGIKAVAVNSGKNKGMGDYTQPMTAEQKQIFQGLVDEAYEQFVSIVADGRKMDIKAVKQLADGRIYTAQQAVQNKLVDQIGTLDEAVADMKSTYKLHDCKTYDIVKPDEGFFSSFMSAITSLRNSDKSELSQLSEFMKENEGFTISYKCNINK